MGLIKSWLWILVYLTLFLKLNPILAICQSFDYVTTASPSISWTIGNGSYHSYTFTGGSRVEIIFSTPYTFSTPYVGGVVACGFFCNADCNNYLFAIFYTHIWDLKDGGSDLPQVVWSTNRNSPVRINATLELTTSGLVLKDSDKTITWSTNTGGKSVAGLNLTDTGNLLLLDKDNVVIWQSFDHPTDTLLRGQRLKAGQKLTANASSTNWSDGGLFSLSVTNEGLLAFVESNPPQIYYQLIVNEGKMESEEPCYVRNINGTFGFYIPSSNKSELDMMTQISQSFSTRKIGESTLSGPYMRLESDGHFRFYEDLGGDVFDIANDCAYPMACGKYGVCTKSKCGCPENANGIVYFKQTSYREPELGCSEITPLSCQVPQLHSFLELENITYFNFIADRVNVDSESCKQACLKNCSCKAVIFRYYGLNRTEGQCYLPTEVFSFMSHEEEYSAYRFITYIKVQNNIPSSVGIRKKEKKIPVVQLVSSFGAIFVLFSIGILVFIFWKRKQANDDDNEEDHMDHVPGMPERFSYDDLKAITQNFNEKLGEGGFGTVFEGTLNNGMRVAVKRLGNFGQIKKSFLAEVATIGSIHHVNLVRMIGFCAEKSHRLLVYQYMPNGSLDKWIFHKTYDLLLSWKQRKKIILDIAKGLSYLHEDCRQKIIHLDIKPENILLDEDFNGKVSDFGLSKLIERDQSQVVTTLRGTPGYLAPEWLSSVITEKVDVYSFGIVTMEILCGRRNVDRSQPEEAMHLLALFKQKYEENQLVGLIDKCCVDMQSHEAEVINMMKVAAWCLQSHYVKRPSMSMVVKVLEGVADIEHNLDYDFTKAPVFGDRGAKFGHQQENHDDVATLLLPSVLSQPR